MTNLCASSSCVICPTLDKVSSAPQAIAPAPAAPAPAPPAAPQAAEPPAVVPEAPAPAPAPGEDAPLKLGRRAVIPVIWGFGLR